MQVSKTIIALTCILTAGCGGSLVAATATWLGTAPGANSTRWGRADNWSTSAVPTSADSVVFSNTGIYGTAVDLRSNQAANDLTFNTTSSFNLVDGTGSNTLTLTSGNITTSAGNSGNQSLDFTSLAMTASGTLTFTANGTGTLGVTASIVNSSYTHLTKTGTGTLVLSGNNSYQGSTNINAGVLRVTTATALGTADYNNTVASGAALELDGSFTLNESGITLNGSGIGGNGALRSVSGTNAFNGQLTLNGSGATIGTDSGASFSLGGQINGGALTKVGSGTLTLTGSTNSYASSIVVNAGTVVLNRSSGSNLVASDITINTGTVRLAASGQIADYKSVTVASAGTFDLNNFNETVTSLSMAAGAVTTGTGTLTLSGGSAITTSANASGSTISGNLALSPYSAALNIADGAATYDLDISAVVSGSSILNKTGLGAVRLNNAANSYTGGTIIDAGTVILAPASGDVGIAASGANSYLGQGAITVNTGGTLDISPSGSGNDFTGFNRSITINGGTVRLAPNDEITGIVTGSGMLTFGASGGLLNLDQKLATNVNLGAVLVNAGSGTPGVIRYGTIAGTTGDYGWESGGRDLNIANGNLTGTGHLQFQLNNGAAVEYNQASFGGTLYFQGPTGGNAGVGSSGTTTGRLALNSATTFTVTGGINFDGTMQVTTYNAARTLDANLTVRSGTTAFQGRGTNTTTLDDLTIGATVNGRTLTINDGARAVMDIGYRNSNTYNGGIVLNATTNIAAGGTLEFKQSYSGNTYDQIDVYGNIVGNGTSAKESTVLLNTPTGSLPGTAAGTTFFASGSNLVVNGSGMGGLRVQGTTAAVNGMLTNSRLAATTGTGGTLTMAYTDGGSRSIGSAANLTVASAINLGLESSGGTFTLSGNLSNWGGLSVGPSTTVAFSSNSVFTSSDSLTLKTGATLSLAGTTQTFGAVDVVGSAIIDFGGTSILNISSLTIASGATLTITGWTESIDYFYSLVSPSVADLAKITFIGTGYPPGSKWDSFDKQISPVPEPGSYGLLMVGGLIGLICSRRRRRF